MKKNSKKRIGEWTKYPHIYGCYWANNRTIEIDIILNRNRFITDYNIKRRCMFMPRYIEREIVYTTTMILQQEIVYEAYRSIASLRCEFFDHVECYLDQYNNYIIITSPYHTNIILAGWKQIYNMYTKNSVTFLIKILSTKNRKALRI